MGTPLEFDNWKLILQLPLVTGNSAVADCTQLSWTIQKLWSFKDDYTQKISKYATYLVLRQMPPRTTAQNLTFLESFLLLILNP